MVNTANSNIHQWRAPARRHQCKHHCLPPVHSFTFFFMIIRSVEIPSFSRSRGSLRIISVYARGPRRLESVKLKSRFTEVVFVLQVRPTDRNSAPSPSEIVFTLFSPSCDERPPVSPTSHSGVLAPFRAGLAVFSTFSSPFEFFSVLVVSVQYFSLSIPAVVTIRDSGHVQWNGTMEVPTIV